MQFFCLRKFALDQSPYAQRRPNVEANDRKVGKQTFGGWAFPSAGSVTAVQANRVGAVHMTKKMSRSSRIDLQPKQLRHFLEVVESRSITAACEVLNITQPALSKSIKQLEQRLGVELFERTPSGVVLNRYGEIFARRARLMEMEYRHALAEINAAKTGAAGSIRIGGGPGWIDTILPPAITMFQRQHPKVKFAVESGVIDTLIPKVLSGDLDIVCSSLDFPNHPELVKERLIDMKHAVFASIEHPLSKKKTVFPKDLCAYPWIWPLNDHVGRNRLESFFAACELDPPEIAAEVEASFSTILKFAKHGNYLVSAPHTLRDDAKQIGLKVILKETRLWETPAGLTFRYTDKPQPVLNSFIALLKVQFQTFADDEGLSIGGSV